MLLRNTFRTNIFLCLSAFSLLFASQAQALVGVNVQFQAPGSFGDADGYTNQTVVTEVKYRPVLAQNALDTTLAVKVGINPEVVSAGAGYIPTEIYMVLTEELIWTQQQAANKFIQAGSVAEIDYPVWNTVWKEQSKFFPKHVGNSALTFQDAIASLTDPTAQQQWQDAMAYLDAFYSSTAFKHQVKEALKRLAERIIPSFPLAYAQSTTDGSFDVDAIIETSIAAGIGGAVAGSVVPGAGNAALGTKGLITGVVGQTVKETWDVIGDDVTNWCDEAWDTACAAGKQVKEDLCNVPRALKEEWELGEKGIFKVFFQ